MELLAELSHFIERDSMKRFDGLPPVNQTVALTMLNADNPSLVIDAFIAGIADASPEIRNEIKLQYWVTVMAMAKLEELQPNFFKTDVILPNVDEQSLDSLSDTDRGKISSAITNYRKIGIIGGSPLHGVCGQILSQTKPGLYDFVSGNTKVGKTQFPHLYGTPEYPTQPTQFEMDPQDVRDKIEAAIAFSNKQRNAERICLVIGDSELEKVILEKLPQHIQHRTDVLVLKGNECDKEYIENLKDSYESLIIDSSLDERILQDIAQIYKDNSPIGQVRSLSQHLAMEIEASRVPDMKYLKEAEPSPIFSPKQRGRKKGGFKGGHRRF